MDPLWIGEFVFQRREFVFQRREVLGVALMMSRLTDGSGYRNAGGQKGRSSAHAKTISGEFM